MTVVSKGCALAVFQTVKCRLERHDSKTSNFDFLDANMISAKSRLLMVVLKNKTG